MVDTSPLSLILIGKFKIKCNMRDKFLASAKIVLDKTQKEKDCISYFILENVFEKNLFFYVEEWKNGSALHLHLKQAYTEKLFSLFANLIDGEPHIKVYDVSNIRYGLEDFLK